MNTFSRKVVLASFKIVVALFIICMVITMFTVYKCNQHKKLIDELNNKIAELETKIDAQNTKNDELVDEMNKMKEYIDKIEKEIQEKDNTENETESTCSETEEPVLVSLGEFKLTAYCSCQKCCGKWALNRPKDENGNEIVKGSSGEVLIPKVSIAVDTSVIPHGSEIVINGNTYIAHDTGGSIKGNRIDVYHDNHQEAREFAVQYAEVFLVSN